MNNSSERKLELEHVIPQYKLLFGKSTTLDEVIDVTSLALKAIGNKAQETFSLRTTIKDYKVPFPCDMYLIKSVTKAEAFTNYDLIGLSKATGLTANLYEGNLIPYQEILGPEGTVVGYVTYAPVTSTEYNKNVVTRPQGDFVDFNNNGRDRLTFNVTDLPIEIIYKAPLLDPNNLPYVDEKTVTAICYYINYLDIQRRYFAKTADANMYQMALELKNRYVGQARIGDVFTDNQTDRVLGHALSLNRKMRGLPNKI